MKIIAGPDSISEDNFDEVYEIAAINIKGKKAIFGTRIVGLKSRSSLEDSSHHLGIDYPAFSQNVATFTQTKQIDKLEMMPSIKMTKKFIEDTDLLVATEIMSPLIQAELYEQISIPAKRLLLWNPSVNQLGWNIYLNTQYAMRNNWLIGIKNGKWIGDTDEKAKKDDRSIKTPIEKTWEGLTKYCKNTRKNQQKTKRQEKSGEENPNETQNTQDIKHVDHNALLIHRGFELSEKGDFRAPPVHNLAKRVKERTKLPLFFDPSHSYGPQKVDEIVDGTIKALQIKDIHGDYLYDGLLIEVGTSGTTSDVDQHISISDLQKLVKELSQFRQLETIS
jgi:hypothetical protein